MDEFDKVCESLLCEVQTYVPYKQNRYGAWIQITAGEHLVEILVGNKAGTQGQWSQRTLAVDGHSSDEEVISYVRSSMKPQLMYALALYSKLSRVKNYRNTPDNFISTV